MVFVALITAATFTVLTGIILAAYYTLTAETVVERRLKSFAPDRGDGAAKKRSAESGPNALQQLLTSIGRFMGGGEGKLNQTLSAAGIRGPNATAIFIGARTFVSIGPALLYLVPQVSAGKPLGRALLTSLLIFAGGHLVVNYIIRSRKRRRMRLITEGLPDTLDLMVVCMEAGLGLNPTIARVGEERAMMNDPLGREFSQVAMELRSGRSREESLRGLGSRNGVDDLKSLAGLIVQSDRLGASMARTLRAHADLLRTRRRQRAEEAARQLPIKMLLPLGGFILPALLIVTMGPALLGIKALFKMLARG